MRKVNSVILAITNDIFEFPIRVYDTTNEIIRLKHLHATSIVVRIEDVLKFLEDISNDLNQPVDPEEPDQPEEN